MNLNKILDKPMSNVCCRIKSYCELIIENESGIYFFILDIDSICFDNNLVLRKLSNIFENIDDIRNLLKMEVIDKVQKNNKSIFFSNINL
jgi:hypothetical protein